MTDNAYTPTEEEVEAAERQALRAAYDALGDLDEMEDNHQLLAIFSSAGAAEAALVEAEKALCEKSHAADVCWPTGRGPGMLEDIICTAFAADMICADPDDMPIASRLGDRLMLMSRAFIVTEALQNIEIESGGSTPWTHDQTIITAIESCFLNSMYLHAEAAKQVNSMLGE